MTSQLSTVPTKRTSAQSSSEDWFTRPRLFLLLALFIFVAFPGIFLGSESFFYRDMGLFGYPLAHFHREVFWRGEVPLWNPLNNCGVPFLAQWNTLVLYPGALIYLLLPLPWSMNAFVLAHVFLAAGGMYALAWRWTNHRFAACVAGLIFAWNGLTLHSLMWPNNIAALGWMPWVVLAVWRAWVEGGGRRLAIAALTAAMQMLAGAPEIILLTWIVIGVLWLRDFWRGPKSPSPMARRRLLSRLVICSALAGLICAAQLLPFVELLRHSNRDTSFGGSAYAMPLWGWANFFVPLFGCTPSVIGVYSQDAQQWTSSYYMGAATVMFALLAWRARDSRVKWLTGILIIGLVFALGDDGFVYSAIKRAVPALGFIRFPIKYVVLVVFTLPLLAAFGVAAWQRDAATDPRTKRSLGWAAAFVLLVIALVIGWAWVRPVSETVPSIAAMNGLWRGVLLLLIAFGFLFSARSGWPGVLSRVAVLCLLGTDMLTHAPRQNPTVVNRAYGPLPAAMNPLPKLGESRAMLSPTMHRLLESVAWPEPFTFYTSDRRMLLHDCNLIDRVPKVNGFFSLYVRAGDEVGRRLYGSTNYAALPLLDFLGVSQLSSVNEMFRWHVRPTAMPMVTAGQQPIFASRSETLDGIFSEQFSPRSEVYLPIEARSFVADASNACRVLSSKVSAQRITASVEAAAPSVLVIAQTDYPAWRAFIDGKPTRIWRANHAYQAVIVPAGTHQVELRYVDRSFLVGIWISLSALLVCCGLWICDRLLGRRGNPEQSLGYSPA